MSAHQLPEIDQLVISLLPEEARDSARHESSLRDELGLDSLAVVSIVTTIGERTGFDIGTLDPATLELNTLGDLIALARHMAQDGIAAIG